MNFIWLYYSQWSTISVILNEFDETNKNTLGISRTSFYLFISDLMPTSTKHQLVTGQTTYFWSLKKKAQSLAHLNHFRHSYFSRRSEYEMWERINVQLTDWWFKLCAIVCAYQQTETWFIAFKEATIIHQCERFCKFVIVSHANTIPMNS